MVFFANTGVFWANMLVFFANTVVFWANMVVSWENTVVFYGNLRGNYLFTRIIKTNRWDPGVDHHPPPESCSQGITLSGTMKITTSWGKHLDTNLCQIKKILRVLSNKHMSTTPPTLK